MASQKPVQEFVSAKVRLGKCTMRFLRYTEHNSTTPDKYRSIGLLLLVSTGTEAGTSLQGWRTSSQ